MTDTKRSIALIKADFAKFLYEEIASEIDSLCKDDFCAEDVRQAAGCVLSKRLQENPS